MGDVGLQGLSQRLPLFTGRRTCHPQSFESFPRRNVACRARWSPIVRWVLGVRFGSVCPVSVGLVGRAITVCEVSKWPSLSLPGFKLTNGATVTLKEVRCRATSPERVSVDSARKTSQAAPLVVAGRTRSVDGAAVDFTSYRSEPVPPKSPRFHSAIKKPFGEGAHVAQEENQERTLRDQSQREGRTLRTPCTRRCQQ